MDKENKQLAIEAGKGVAKIGGSAGLGGLIGMGISKWEQKKNLEQAKKLQELQLSGAKEMQKIGLDTWQKTGYGAQRKQLEAAGLNAGLMYGMSGTGGTTTSTGTTSGYGTAGMGGTGMGMQLGMKAMETQAQIELAKSQAELNKVNANKISGVDTAAVYQGIEESKQRTLKLAAETGNETLKAAGIEWENKLKETQANTATMSQADILRTYEATADKYEAEADSAATKANKDRATYKDEVAQARLTTAMMATENLLKKENIKLTQAQTDATYKTIEKMSAEMRKWSAERQQAYWKLSVEERELANKKMFAEAYKKQVEFSTDGMAEAERLFGIIGKTGGILMGTGGGATPIKGFGK